jgi:hypothetical protein
MERARLMKVEELDRKITDLYRKANSVNSAGSTPASK